MRRFRAFDLYFQVAFCLIPLITTFNLDKDGNYAVLRGSNVELSCIPKNSNQVEEYGSTYEWTDELGRELIDARYTKKENGNLEIANTHIGDSGIYKCKYLLRFKAELSRVYEHKLIVYELSGHKFVSSGVFDMSTYSTEVILTMLKDFLTISICSHDLCVPGNIKPMKCDEYPGKPCEFSMAYEAINPIADGRCDEECVRQKMFEELKKAERILESELIRMSRDPNGRLKADMKTFDTRHLITCRAGFHLVKAYYKRCFPCLPGSYSEPNSIKCNLCHVGFYQEHYGKRECDPCEEGKTTENMGTKSRDECVAQENKGILSGIKEGLKGIFGRR